MLIASGAAEQANGFWCFVGGTLAGTSLAVTIAAFLTTSPIRTTARPAPATEALSRDVCEGGEGPPHGRQLTSFFVVPTVGSRLQSSESLHTLRDGTKYHSIVYSVIAKAIATQYGLLNSQAVRHRALDVLSGNLSLHRTASAVRTGQGVGAVTRTSPPERLSVEERCQGELGRVEEDENNCEDIQSWPSREDSRGPKGWFLIHSFLLNYRHLCSTSGRPSISGALCLMHMTMRNDSDDRARDDPKHNDLLDGSAAHPRTQRGTHQSSRHA